MNPTKNKAAVALGKRARGIPKTLTPEQRSTMAERCREMVRRRDAARHKAQIIHNAEILTALENTGAAGGVPMSLDEIQTAKAPEGGAQ